MPGFESRRFVNITELQIEELMCGICLGIVNNPFVAKCCKQLYCYDCITEWLRCNNTCPHDRSQLQSENLEKSEKHLDLVENLQIHCDYESYGCEVTQTLKHLSQHLESCVYDPERKCNVCGLKMGHIDKHNCIELLIEEKEKIQRELDAIKEKNFDAERHCWDNTLWCI